MRKIGIKEIEDIALGAALLGSGGGGDPYVGKLVAMGAIQECGPVTLLDPQEVPDDALIVPIAMMGAPTVLIEKGTGGKEYQTLYDTVSQFFGKPIYAFMPMEAGGVNSMLPIAAAARLQIPMVDVDGMGRAFPELQMVTFTIGGISATPMALTDEKGNNVIFRTITNKWTEELARAVTMACGGAVSVSLYPMSGKQMKDYGVHGIVTRSEKLGAAIRQCRDTREGTPEESFLKHSGGIRLFKGKIVDVLRETNGAFNLGRVILNGIGEYRGRKASVTFQNENLCAEVDGKMIATVPDLICLVDVETFTPIPTDALRYGKRVMAVGLPCFPLWRTKEGLELGRAQIFWNRHRLYSRGRTRKGGLLVCTGWESMWEERTQTRFWLMKTAEWRRKSSILPQETYTKELSERSARCWSSQASAAEKSGRPCWARPSAPMPL